MKSKPAGSDGAPLSVPAAPFPRRGRRRIRDELMEAMLLAVGELGYEKVAVRHVVERSGVSRSSFYTRFASKQTCFLAAQREADDWLYRRLLGVAALQPNWRAGVAAALAELVELCARRPLLAKALLVDARTAGKDAVLERMRLIERFATQLDRVRDELPDGSSPPPAAAAFVVGGIDSLVSARLLNGEAPRLPELLPGLIFATVLPFLGEVGALEEMSTAAAARWRAQRRAAAER